MFPFSRGIPPPAGVSRSLPREPGNRPPGSQGAPGPGGISPGTPAPAPFQPRHHAPPLATPARAGAILAAASRPGCTRRTRATSHGRCSTPERRRSGRDRRGRLPDSWLLSPPLRSGLVSTAAGGDPLIRGGHGHSFAASRTILRGPWPERRGSRAVRPRTAQQVHHGSAGAPRCTLAAGDARQCEPQIMMVRFSRQGPAVLREDSGSASVRTTATVGRPVCRSVR